MAFVPALYAWFNIVGFWDPYAQTSHIRVAVANEDEGATKDKLGMVNVGAMVETQLKQNDQLGWHFVSADEARAEVERGDSYAAFVIPASFSRDLTGIVDGTYVQPNIQYYVNEKNNAVAPKITGAGATALDRQINSTFVSTVAKVLSEKASEAGVSLADQADQARSDLTGAPSTNDSLGSVLSELNAAGVGNLPAAGSALSDLSSQNSALSTALSDLTTLNSDLSTTSTSISTALSSASSAASSVQTSVSNARAGVSGQVPTLSSALDDFSSASSSMRGSLDTLRGQRDQVSSLLDQLDSLLDDAKKSTSTSATNVSAIKSDLETVSTDISSVASSNTLRDLSDTLGTNAASIASFMASPTSIETQAVYPVASYGSAMAPLFTNLALWIGAFSLVLLLKLDVDEEGIGPTSSAAKYMGRWMLLGFFGVIQALVVSIGVLIIGVQTVSRPAFVGTSIVISLVFTSIVYMLSTCFQHIGKGLCVIIMVMQIPGSAGLYPIEMLPSFFRFLHPLFPFTYGINAMRETVAGFYGHTFLSCLAVLGLQALVAFAIGLALRPFLVNLNAMITRDLASSGLFQAEATRVPSSRYRLTQIVAALADHDGFQRSVSSRAARFERRYPWIRRAAIVIGVIVPVVLAVLSVTNAAEVPVVLGAWIVWVLLVITLLIGLQYVREALERQQLLGAMDEGDVRSLLTRRVQGVRSRIALGAAAVSASISSALEASLAHYDAEHGSDASEEAVDEASPGSADTARSPQGQTTDGPDPGLVDTPDGAEDEEDAK